MCCARAVSAASSGHTNRRRWPPAISSWSRAPAAAGTARPTQYNRPQEMNPTAIYSKSGKGVQEAAGKTSLLTRPDRAVLSAIDGRATLAEVAQKVGKTYDAAFQTLVATLDKNGFVREVSAGAAAPAAAPKPAAAPTAAPPKPAAKPAASDGACDLDFSSLSVAPKPASPQ